MHREKADGMRWWLLVFVLLVMGGQSACVTSRESTVNWEEIMRSVATAAPAPEPDERVAPDAPPGELPPPPLTVGETVVGNVVIQPDSIVKVTVKEDAGLNGSYTVNELNAIELSYVGPVFLYNMTEQNAADKIRDVLEARFFKQATVQVELQRASYDKIMIEGEVGAPGVLKIGSGDRVSLNDALLRAGRLTAPVKNVRVRVVRGGMTDLAAPWMPGETYSLVSEDGEPLIPDVWLWNNDVVFVLPFIRGTPLVKGGPTTSLGPQDVLLLGEVGRQGYYRFGAGEPCTVMNLVFKMGGFRDFADPKHIRIIRRDDQGREEEFEVDATSILDTGDPDLDVPLQNGDRVIVPMRKAWLFDF